MDGYEILEKELLSTNIYRMVVFAPHIAAKVLPGQFVILKKDEKGERIPLTVADYDRKKGTVTVIFQAVGASTIGFGEMQVGEKLQDFVGPLGKPSELDGHGRVAVIGGGLGCAIAFPQAKYLYHNGTEVDLIVGFRNKDLIILEEEMRKNSSSLTILTDDGSNGAKGLVTDGLRTMIENGANYDLVIAIGPPMMMKFVSLLTKEYHIPTIVSMNPIMIDGTGMCGGCRITVGGEMKFACVDGPDFDGHQVDFDELIRRNRMYAQKEREKSCNLLNQAK